MKIQSSNTKIFMAATISWVLFIFSFNAIFEWAEPPWSRYAEEKLIYAAGLPPIIGLVSFKLFHWAFGEAFIQWLTNSKLSIGGLIISVLATSAAVNASNAASYAEWAMSNSDEARDAAQNAENACSYR